MRTVVVNSASHVRNFFPITAGKARFRHPTGRRLAKGGSAAGFTLLELMISIALITIAIFGLLATLLFCIMLDDVTKETNIALNELRRKVDEIRSHDFVSLLACYRSDPPPFHAEHSNNFEVPGLRAQAGDADGMPGKVVIEQIPEDQYAPIIIRVEISWQGRDGTNRGIQVRNIISARRYEK